MSSGQTRLASKIKLMKFVATHRDEWKCKPTCFSCKYWEACYYEMCCEEGEIEERYEYEYRVIAENRSHYTCDYHEAAATMTEWRTLGYDPTFQRRPFDTNRPWVTLA